MTAPHAAMAYCGHWPDRDHSACPSSVECHAVTLADLEGTALLPVDLDLPDDEGRPGGYCEDYPCCGHTDGDPCPGRGLVQEPWWCDECGTHHLGVCPGDVW